MRPADLTLSAGPNDVSARVKAALGAPILYHYDPAFIERFKATEAAVAAIYETTTHEIILMQGEAVLGLEAAARAVVSPGMPVLNLVSGVFGKGMGYWLTAIGAPASLSTNSTLSGKPVTAKRVSVRRVRGALGAPGICNDRPEGTRITSKGVPAASLAVTWAVSNT